MTRALLLLDLTRDVAHKEGRYAPMGSPAHAHSRGVPQRLVAAADAARATGDIVVWTVPGASLFERFGMPASEGWGAAIDEDYGTPAGDELVVEKAEVDAFTGTQLERHLRDCDVDEVVLAGISTTHVVTATAGAAVALGFRTVVATDGCADTSDADHEKALEALPQGVVVTELAQIWPI